MKTDLDTLMQKNDLDALLITGPAQHNSAMYYMTGGGHLTNADLIKKRGEDPILFYNPMERDEAANTGLRTKNLVDYNYPELLKQAEGDRALAFAMRYQNMLEEQGLSGARVALYGKVEFGGLYSVFRALEKLMPDLTLVGEVGDSTLMHARMTKDESEIERMRAIGQITTSVVGETANFLTSHKVKDGVLVKADGQPLTIGEVKRKINLWLAERGAENPAGTIFAIGSDAGVPHSTGNPDDLLELGKTIIYDIFPCETGGGYHYDFTRTWCLGHAPDEAQALYDDVFDVHQTIMSEIKADTPCKVYQDSACDLFEAQGHPTIRQDHTLQEGYVHSLGHGLGLNIHESPWSGSNANDEVDRMTPGVVFTVEPGLYYPSRGMGCRLEDSITVRPDGQIEILSEYPLDFVLPMT